MLGSVDLCSCVVHATNAHCPTLATVWLVECHICSRFSVCEICTQTGRLIPLRHRHVANSNYMYMLLQTFSCTVFYMSVSIPGFVPSLLSCLSGLVVRAPVSHHGLNLARVQLAAQLFSLKLADCLECFL